jgi:hypothetical protein
MFMARFFCAVLVIWLVAPGIGAAQSPDDPTNQVKIGDRWSYGAKDDITGLPVNAYTAIVTEISPQEIVTSLSFPGKPGAHALVVFDHQWNRVENGAWKYRPNDAQGVQSPIAVGKEWRIEFTGRNSQNGAAVKGTARSKVTAQETVTTPAGTFDTFKIERHVQEVNAADPSRVSETDAVLWYAPEISHWVRRTFVSKIERRTSASQSEELTAYGRKE